eukprot:scaffold16209_cov36-Phaeocystis_antarctica.AAC.1
MADALHVPMCVRSTYIQLDLVLGARGVGAAARLPAAAAGWAKSIDPLLPHEVEDVHRLGSLGYQTGPSEPQLTTSGRATCTKWLMSSPHQIRL